MQADGFELVSDLQALGERDLVARYGKFGRRLAQFVNGADDRRVTPDRPTKSISAETTFDRDTGTFSQLMDEVRQLSERVAQRLVRNGLAGRTVVLKLKTAAFATRTRAYRLARPTTLPDLLFAAARILLARETDGTFYRLIGIGAAPLLPGGLADQPDLADPGAPKRVAAQAAIDQLRDKFGTKIIAKGRSMR